MACATFTFSAKSEREYDDIARIRTVEVNTENQAVSGNEDLNLVCAERKYFEIHNIELVSFTE